MVPANYSNTISLLIYRWVVLRNGVDLCIQKDMVSNGSLWCRWKLSPPQLNHTHTRPLNLAEQQFWKHWLMKLPKMYVCIQLHLSPTPMPNRKFLRPFVAPWSGLLAPNVSKIEHFGVKIWNWMPHFVSLSKIYLNQIGKQLNICSERNNEGLTGTCPLLQKHVTGKQCIFMVLYWDVKSPKKPYTRPFLPYIQWKAN